MSAGHAARCGPRHRRDRDISPPTAPAAHPPPLLFDPPLKRETL